MKALATLAGLFIYLIPVAARAQQGLKGEYYTGINFDRKVVTRLDPEINFDWKGRSPAPGLSHSYYSIRWTGKLMAPLSGKYTFNARVDDGVRVWVGNKKVIDAWYLNDSNRFGGSVILEAGKYYDLRIDYFNDLLEGEIELFWVLPNAPKTIFNGFSNPGESITAKYFFQKAPPIVIAETQIKPVATTPVIAASPPPKVIPKKPLTIAKPKTILTPPPSKQTAVVDTLVASAPIRKPASEPESELKAGTTFVLRSVQFEQSSYILRPESSAELDQLVTTLKKNPHWSIEIAGHTDNVGDPRLNLALSENRAKVVSSYLTRRDIADERVTSKGYGGTRPIADNAIESERSKNRRVEITIR
ncbi:OmpA family protein [Spirosoma endophyticum]|uniref:Outer membrane protein OmpA n=1 Tax=Spirosoma endophyticum TaxID=662367 RepID=A0A1I1VBE8_9BACT|nr:PA14 domain-containing protein [Spirosoma endophyticum]SFD80307.1 Outer membrane protein OmpA [Spirosoma endophyticum]